MLRWSGFELYSRWVPQPRETTWVATYLAGCPLPFFFPPSPCPPPPPYPPPLRVDKRAHLVAAYRAEFPPLFSFNHPPPPPPPLRVPQRACSQAITFPTYGTTVVFPQFKSKMQIQIIRAKSGEPVMYRNVFHAAYVIVKTHGIRGAYQGLPATWLRNIPANSAFFGELHSTIKQAQTASF